MLKESLAFVAKDVGYRNKICEIDTIPHLMNKPVYWADITY